MESKKLQLKDRTRNRQPITGYSMSNMVRRMYGSTAYALSTQLDTPCTICKNGGRVIGTAIFHEA